MEIQVNPDSIFIKDPEKCPLVDSIFLDDNWNEIYTESLLDHIIITSKKTLLGLEGRLYESCKNGIQLKEIFYNVIRYKSLRNQSSMATR